MFHQPRRNHNILVNSCRRRLFQLPYCFIIFLKHYLLKLGVATNLLFLLHDLLRLQRVPSRDLPTGHGVGEVFDR